MPATAYVITSRISNGDVSFLTWAQLHALEQSGVEIGSHTVHHCGAAALSDPAALQELIQSRRALEQHLHHPVQWFAYPAGKFDEHSVGSCARPATCSRSPRSPARRRTPGRRSRCTATRCWTRPASAGSRRCSPGRVRGPVKAAKGARDGG